MKRNRIITTLLVVCTSLLLAFSLTACGKKCEHTYLSDCAEICNECGETRTTTTEHYYYGDCDGVCHNCGEDREVTAPHSWKPATCTTGEACEGCGAVRSESLGHTWQEADCTTPKTCTLCQTTEGNALEHTPAEDDGDCTTAITCSDCGTVTTEAQQAHTPNGDDGDCTTSVTCEHCDHIFVEVKSHNFATGEAWSSTHTEHWYSCLNEGCEAKNDYGEHVPEEDDGDCTTHLLCDVCGWVVVKGNDSHTPNADDGNCLTAITCSVCGTVTTEAKEAHTLERYVDNGNDTHSLACQYCDYVDRREPHIMDENCKCSVCGTEQHYVPGADWGDCLCHYCMEMIHNLDENCVCRVCSLSVHTVNSTTGICLACNNFTAAASVTVDGVKAYYAIFDEAIACANGKDGALIVIENDCENQTNITKFTSGSVTIDLNGKTIGLMFDYCIPIDGATVIVRDSVGGGKALRITGWSGTLIIEDGIHEEVYAPDNLVITGGEFTNVYVNSYKEAVALSGGSYEAIHVIQTHSFAAILEDGYCFYDEEGNVVDVSTIEIVNGYYHLYNVTVGEIK